MSTIQLDESENKGAFRIPYDELSAAYANGYRKAMDDMYAIKPVEHIINITHKVMVTKEIHDVIYNEGFSDGHKKGFEDGQATIKFCPSCSHKYPTNDEVGTNKV